MPNVTIVGTLKCPEGPSGTAEWTGVRLSHILNMTNVSEQAVDVIFRGADGFHSSLTIDEASEPDILLAWGMNGVALPRDQGFPLKLVAPGHYGYKWVKWITSIEIVEYDHLGYWESQGWSDDASITPASQWSLHAYLLSIGFIFCGLAMVSGYKVEGQSDVWYYLPDYVNYKFHVWTSKVFMLILIFTFAYWVWSTNEARGDIFYSVHGLLSLFIVIAFVLSGAFSTSKKKWGQAIHGQAAVFGFMLYALVMFLGFILAWGSG